MTPGELAKHIDMARTVESLLWGNNDEREQARLRSLAWSSFGWHLALEAYRECEQKGLLYDREGK